MLSQVFLGMALVGAEWVMYLLLGLSVLSVALIIERIVFYRGASRGLSEFRGQIRSSAASGNLDAAKRAASERAAGSKFDLEGEMASTLLQSPSHSPDVLSELANDAVTRARLGWEKNLSVLATIGANAPFIGLFGTVLGIIQAFHDLSQQAGAGAQVVTAGISEALVATAVGLLVAIPAVIAFNLFQRRVKAALAEAEALKSYLIGRLAK
jgi:biopolymer transport protein ExbB